MTLNKPWLAQYPKSVPKTIDPDRYGSIVELYEECFDRFRLHPMSICMGVTHTYDDIDKASLAVALATSTRTASRQRGCADDAKRAAILANHDWYFARRLRLYAR